MGDIDAKQIVFSKYVLADETSVSLCIIPDSNRFRGLKGLETPFQSPWVATL